MDEDLLEAIDDKADNRSEWIQEKIRKLVTDSTYLRREKKELEDERERLRRRKQEIEQRIWELDDRIEELNDEISKAETLEDVRDEIGMNKIQRIQKTARKNKYDNDPRSATVEQVILNNAQRIADEEDLEVSLVERVLRLHISV